MPSFSPLYGAPTIVTVSAQATMASNFIGAEFTLDNTAARAVDFDFSLSLKLTSHNPSVVVSAYVYAVPSMDGVTYVDNWTASNFSGNTTSNTAPGAAALLARVDYPTYISDQFISFSLLNTLGWVPPFCGILLYNLTGLALAQAPVWTYRPVTYGYV